MGKHSETPQLDQQSSSTKESPDVKSKSIKKKVIASSNNNGGENDDVKVKYNKLKKKYRYLSEEMSKLLESWEQAAKTNKMLLEERR